MHTGEELKKKREHTFLVGFFLHFVNNILLEIISKHIMASNKKG